MPGSFPQLSSPRHAYITPATSIVAADLLSDGVAALQFVSAAVFTSALAAAGTGLLNFLSLAFATGVLASTGVAASNLIAAGLFLALLDSQGVGVATLDGDIAPTERDLQAAGLGTFNATSGVVSQVELAAAGIGVASFVGDDASVTILPIGTVPVRYIISGEDDNIVPVETVLVGGIDVVSVREFVGPNNVVPVREAVTETPRVKVVKV